MTKNRKLKRLGRKLLSFLLTLAMLVGQMPGMSLTVHAATDYKLWVGSTEVTSENIEGNNWSYDATNNILTLNNYSGTAGKQIKPSDWGTNQYYCGICYTGDNPLTIQLVGNNTISLGDGSNGYHESGIFILKSRLDIVGSDKLDSLSINTGKATGGNGSYCWNYGICVNQTGDLYINNCTLEVDAGVAEGGSNGNSSYGLYAGSNKIIIDNNSTVTAKGNTSAVFGKVKTSATCLGWNSTDLDGEGDSIATSATTETSIAGSYKVIKLTPPATAAYDVTITPGSHMTKTSASGDASQNVVVDGSINSVVYTAEEGYYFPTDYSVATVNGISVNRTSYTQITVSGTPTADAAITLTAPTAKTTPDAPTTAAAVNCTTASNNDGKLTGVATTMEYKKSDAENWTDGTGSDITSLLPGTYYVRLKATDTALNSGNQELTILEYEKTAAAVIVKIDALQEENDVRPADVEDIHEARDAYDALTDAQKAIVDDTVIAKLTACEAALITTIVNAINDIPAITESNKDDVRELLESYDKLTDTEKDTVDSRIGRNGTKKLSDLEKALEVTAKIDMLDSPDDIDSADEKAITLARTAYDLLSVSQKAMIPARSLEKLEAAEEKLDQIKADSAAAEAAAKAAAEEAAKLVAARESALDRLRDYADAKALSDATDAEKTYYNNAVNGGIQVINEAENNVTAIAAALTTAKASVDNALAQIKNDRAEAEAEADRAAKLAAAKKYAIERLDDYSEAKALSDATAAEKDAYDLAVADGKTSINEAADNEAVAAALTAAKASVDTALDNIRNDRAEAEAAAKEMAAADKALADAIASANAAIVAATEAHEDQYASDADKSAIETAKGTVEGELATATNLAADATAAQKNTVAENINNAVNDLITATDTANIHSAEAKAEAEAEADRAAKLAAAKKYAIERLFDYSGAKALSDATVAEQIYYAQAVADGELAINATTTEAAVAEKLTDAKKAVDDALAKIKKDRAEAEAAAQKMAAADASLNDAVAAAGDALKEADKAAADEYASDDDKSAIGTAKGTVDAALDASLNLADNATAAEKNTVARDINNAVNGLITATDAANLNSAIARAEAEAAADRAAKLNAAKASAIDRLNDYAGAKALSDATVEEQIDYAKAVADGELAIYGATDEAAVTEKLSDAKKAVDAALAKIKKDRAEAEAAAQEMAAANKALEDAIAAANDAIAAANEAAADEYASDDDKSAIGTAKGKAASLLDASVNFAADATAEQKNAVARDINNAVNDLITVTDTAIINSAETKAEADAAADFAAKLEAAKKYAIERLDDYSEVKALSDATEAEKAAYDRSVSDGKAAINEAADNDAVAAALAEAKVTVNAALSLIKNNRAAAAAADTTSAKTDLVYNENEQELVMSPSKALPSGYTMKYAVTTENTAPADELYTTAIPTAKEAGTYYVWYYVAGEEGFATTAKCIPVTIEDVGSRLNAEKAKKNNLAALGDDTMIVPDASGKVWTLYASINDASSNIVRVKVTFTVGAKVKLNGYDKMLSEQFRIENSYSKQTATISKKGILKAKKAGSGILQYSTADGKIVRIEYTVVKPAIAIADGKDASVNNLASGSVKKLKATYTTAGNFDVKLTGVPLNSTFTFKGTKVLNESNIVIGKDGCLHITGVLESKKTSKVIINAQGKKYTVVIKGKFK